MSQQPVLFPTSIYNNIAAGKEGATEEEVRQAATQANAHDFIMEFPNGYGMDLYIYIYITSHTLVMKHTPLKKVLDEKVKS